MKTSTPGGPTAVSAAAAAHSERQPVALTRTIGQSGGSGARTSPAGVGGATMINRCAAEAFGTFAMVFAGTGAVVIDDVTGGGVTHVGVAVTFGLIVMAMIYAVGGVSGAHLNPAVTLGFWAARRLPGRCVLPYVVCQMSGAVIASLLLRGMFPANGVHLGATLPAGSDAQSFLLEAVLTFMLMCVIFCVSTGPKEVGVMAGVAVGGVIGLEAMFAGPVSGASMNPARSFAPAVVSGHAAHLWVYLTAPVFGALAAIPCWRLIRPPQAAEECGLSDGDVDAAGGHHLHHAEPSGAAVR